MENYSFPKDVLFAKHHTKQHQVGQRMQAS